VEIGLRILHILNHTRSLNGNVHAAVDLACEQAKLGHSVCMASGGGDFDALLQNNHVAQARIDHTRAPLILLKSLAALHALVRKWKPDLVHAHMMTSAVLAWPICKLVGVPLVTTVHNEFEKSAILMGLGTRVIAVSNVVGQSMLKRGISASRLRVVLNGTIGSARFAHRVDSKVVLASPSVLFVGGLHPRKGLPDLMQAFDLAHRETPASRLYIVGAGPFETEYREMASRMACAHAIEFLGPQADPYQWMVKADIFVLPSHADPAPLVLSEAREAGCAVVGSNVDGIPQLLEYGAAGLLYEVRNVTALSDILKSLLQSPAMVEEWKTKSQLNLERMTIARVALETLDVYRNAGAEGRTVAPGVANVSSTGMP
jgi:glycosyltransferase involved in cell wall biosynthesis